MEERLKLWEKVSSLYKEQEKGSSVLVCSKLNIFFIRLTNWAPAEHCVSINAVLT